jgi:hypothetical protein
MEYIISLSISLLGVVLQPILQNSTFGRDITRDLRYVGEIKQDVAAWVVKDKFNHSKLKYFYSMDEALEYSNTLLVSHVIFDRYQNILAVKGYGFGKNICRRSGRQFLEQYYQTLEQNTPLQECESKIESLRRSCLLHNLTHNPFFCDLIFRKIDMLYTEARVYYDEKLYFKSREKIRACMSIVEELRKSFEYYVDIGNLAVRDYP